MTLYEFAAWFELSSTASVREGPDGDAPIEGLEEEEVEEEEAVDTVEANPLWRQHQDESPFQKLQRRLP